ncbi:MAG TPA: hypothetical protein VEZ40_12705 [Pyrinomonadaceae bacterium]|jgi:hypothetical protein|nr:hypothetical protein [Pyrinomonadaceae bacterium]
MKFEDLLDDPPLLTVSPHPLTEHAGVKTTATGIQYPVDDAISLRRHLSP